MNKTFLIVVFLAVVAGGLFYYGKSQQAAPVDSSAAGGTQLAGDRVASGTFDAMNSTFTIDGKSVTLKEGLSEEPAAGGSAAKVVTRYFGNEAIGDINGDGIEDRAFLVTQQTGGSGTFYYVVAALGQGDTFTTTNAYFIGDRIAPQTTEIRSSDKELLVNYADRKAGEPMTAQPSMGATLYLKVTTEGVLEGVLK